MTLKSQREILERFIWVRPKDLENLAYPGWNNIVYWFCEQLEKNNIVEHIKTTGFPFIKEKLGYLRISHHQYYYKCTEEQKNLIDEALMFVGLEGQHTCYFCGAPDAKLRNKSGLLICLCEEDWKQIKFVGRVKDER